MKKVQVDDVTLNVCHEGSGRPLLLVHGFPLDHTMWRHQIAEFSREYQVIAPDLRGFGGSELGKGEYSQARLADDLAGLLLALEVTQPVIFCGLSMGGYVAWQFWDRHADRLEKLILCDTRAAADTAEAAQGRREAASNVIAEGSAGLVAGMLPKLFADATEGNSPESIRDTQSVMQGTSPETIAAALVAMADRPNMEPRLGEIRVPALLLCGEHDVITPVEEMRRVAAAMPTAEFQSIAEAGHMSPLEQPVDVNRAIREFIR